MVKSSWDQVLVALILIKIMTKLSNLKIIMKEWNYTVMGNIDQHIVMIEMAVQNTQLISNLDV